MAVCGLITDCNILSIRRIYTTAYQWLVSDSECIAWRTAVRSNRRRTVCRLSWQTARWPAACCSSCTWSIQSALPFHYISIHPCRLPTHT